MNWIFTAATIMAAMAILARLLRWVFDRSHRLAEQRQSPGRGSRDRDAWRGPDARMERELRKVALTGGRRMGLRRRSRAQY